MFWRERGWNMGEQNGGGPHCGQVRVLVVGDSGVIFVHDLSQRRTKTSLNKWAAEIAATGSFSAPLGSGGPGGLLVPYLVIGNKADIAAKDRTRESSGNLVDVARQWVEKQGLLPSSEELPLTESFPVSSTLLMAAKEAVRSRLSATSAYEDLRDPSALVAPPIPPCKDKFFIKYPCFDFVWSGNASVRAARILSAIMRNNPGRPIPFDKVKSFGGTPDDVDAWLVSDPMRCPGALHFVEKSSTVISYGVQTNSSAVAKRGNYEDPTFKFQVPL